MRFDELPAALQAAGTRLTQLPDTIGTAAAHLVLEAADPPRKTGALAATGRVVAHAAVFGDGAVDYAAPVHARDPFLERAVDATMAAVLDLADTALADAITL